MIATHDSATTIMPMINPIWLSLGLATCDSDSFAVDRIIDVVSTGCSVEFSSDGEVLNIDEVDGVLVGANVVPLGVETAVVGRIGLKLGAVDVIVVVVGGIVGDDDVVVVVVGAAVDVVVYVDVVVVGGSVGHGVVGS